MSFAVSSQAFASVEWNNLSGDSVEKASLAFAKGPNTITLAHNHFVVPRDDVCKPPRPYTTFSSAAALGADPETPCGPEAL